MNEWIKVDKHKPDKDVEILCLLSDGKCTVLKRVSDWDYKPSIPYDAYWGMYNTLAAVTHWMPLPEMPLPNPPDVEAKETRPLESRLPGNNHANTGEYLVKLV